jgi:hypothetical protein
LCAVFLCASCSPKIDKNKFRDADHTAGALQRSLAADVTFHDFSELLQRFSDRITVLENAVKSKRERELVHEYVELLKMYQDGFLLWKCHREFSGHSFVPEGRIYVGQDVEPLVLKYRFETESHVYKPTGQHWKSISADSIKVVWQSADQQRKRINTLLNEEG